MICLENNNNYYCDEDFASFGTCRFSTLKKIFGHLEGVLVVITTLDMNRCVCIKTYIYTYTYIHAHTRKYMYIIIHIHTYMYIIIYTYTHIRGYDRY